MAVLSRRAPVAVPSSVPRAGIPDWADVLGRASGENFPVALRVLGSDLRRHLMAVYGFARLVDDIGDEAAGDRSALLDDVERDLDRVWSGTPELPLMQALARSVRERCLPEEPFRLLVAANRQDLAVQRYETFEDLAGYCALSANPVGRLVLHVLDAATPERIRMSDAVCTALQLAEHWQDVGEDFVRGRVYLPQEDLRAHRVAEPELAAPVASDALRRLVAFELDRTARILRSGAPLVGTLTGRGRLAVAGYVGGGFAALHAIRAADHDVLGYHCAPSRALQARMALAVLARPRGLRWT